MKRLLYFILVILLLPTCTERMVETTGDVYGTVQDAKTGNPLDNCSVVLNPSGLSTTTGSNGSFRFVYVEGGEYSLQASRSGYITNSTNVTVVPGSSVRTDLLLTDEASTRGQIRGAIVDADSQMPLSGCLVVLLPGNQSKVTDEWGTFHFENLTPGEYSIRVTRDKYLEQVKYDVQVQAGTETSVQFLLYDESTTKGTITGVVRDSETNAVLEGCLVTLQPGGASKLTDPEGAFNFEELAPAEYEITVTKKDYSSYTKRVTVEPGKTQTVEILLYKESAMKGGITGMVRDDETNAVLERCLVTLQPGGASKLTDPEGGFSFEELAPGEYEITVTKRDYLSYAKRVTVESGKTQTVEILLTKESATKGSVAGMVKGAETQAAIVGCKVTLVETGANVETNDSGEFGFENLDPGTYSLRFEKDGYFDQDKTGIVVRAKEVTSVQVFMKEISSDQQPPVFGTVLASNISAGSARLNGTLSDEGSAPVTERGFLVSRTSDPRSDYGAIRVRAAGGGAGDFYGVVSGLSASTLYYACAYATTSSETAYSDAISFMTLSQGDVSVPSNVICVSLSGDDNNDGSAWTSSKRTIGAAIKSAGSGQEIWVALGSYSETIAPGDGIPVYGGFNGTEKTVNDRQPGSRTSVRGISCDVYTRETVVDGFKVSGGSGVKLQDYAILRNCEICNNTYNVVTVSCERKSCIIENCSIYGNTLRSGTSGAVTTARTGVVTLVNCFLQGNDQGPAIYNAGYVKTINCVIANNYEGVRSWGSGADFINTTFAGNRNFALAVNNDVQLYNCIIWDDQILNYEGNSIAITLESCVHEPDGDNSAIRFVSPVAYGDDWTKADWSLSSGSSCIDRGVNIFYAIDEDPYDIAGNPRITNGTIDIGAYEYQR